MLLVAGATAASAQAAEVDEASLEVAHPVPAQATTWGRIKSLYR